MLLFSFSPPTYYVNYKDNILDLGGPMVQYSNGEVWRGTPGRVIQTLPRQRHVICLSMHEFVRARRAVDVLCC